MVDLNGKLRLHGSFEHTVAHIGAELAPVLIIDNFLSDPHVLIDYAAAHSQFGSVSDAFYPGLRAPIPQIYSFAVRAFLGTLIGETFGLGANRVVKELSSFSLVTTPRERLEVPQRLPHFDNTDERQLALLHYLCPSTQGGTSFYRHRATGFETIRPNRASEYMKTLDNELAQHGPPAARYINGDNVLFERIASFEAVFNRMLVYRSIALHSADIPPDFRSDANPRTGRLTANTFYYFR
jgi:hypothetical protein